MGSMKFELHHDRQQCKGAAAREIKTFSLGEKVAEVRGRMRGHFLKSFAGWEWAW